MTKISALRRLLTRKTVALVGFVSMVLLMLLAAPAMAVPGFGECKDPPIPERPGEGLVGQIDQAPLGTGRPGSVYDDYGYGGMVWNTYDVCFRDNPWASVDTWIGNELFSAAKGVVALVNMLHYQMVSGQSVLSSLDGLVNEASTVIYSGAYVPYLAFVLVLVAVGVLWFALSGNLAAASAKTAYVLIGMFVASTAYLTPMTYVGISDQLLVHGASELESNMIRQVSGDQRHGLPTMLHEEVVHKTWLTGEFGSADSPEAGEHGRALLDAQACSKVEALQNNCDVPSKQDQFKTVATDLEQTAAYQHFTGEKTNRAGQGLFAIIKAFCFGLFQVFAKFGVLLAQLGLRAFIVGAPIFALLGMLSNNVLPSLGKRIGVTVGMGLLLVFSGAVHVIGMTWVLEAGFVGVVEVLLMAALTTVMFFFIRPGDRIRQMAAATSGRDIPLGQELRQRRMMRRMSRNMRRRDGRFGRWIGNKVDAAEGPDSEFWMERGERDPSQGQPTPSDVGADEGTGLARRAGTAWDGGRRPESEPVTVPSTRVQPRPHGLAEPAAVSTGQGSIPASQDGPWAPSGRPRGNRGEAHGGTPFVATPQGAIARSETQKAAGDSSSAEQRPRAAKDEVFRRSEAAADRWNTAERADGNRPRPSRPGTVHDQATRLHKIYRPNTSNDATDTGGETPRRHPRPESREE